MGDLAAQELFIAVECSYHDLGILPAERHHIDGRKLEVRRHPDLGHRDDMPLEIGIMNIAVRQDLGNRMAHGLADAQLALRAAAGRVLLMMAGHYPILMQNPDRRHSPRKGGRPRSSKLFSDYRMPRLCGA